MQATGSISSKAPRAREAGQPAMRRHSQFTVDGTPPGPAVGRLRAASGVFARWIGRAVSDSGRAWALAAGVYPDLHD